METNKAKILRILKENKEAFKTTDVDAPKQTAESVGVAKRIEEIIDNAFIMGQDTSRLVENDGFHPSSLGIKAGKCGRRNVYLLRGVRREPSTNARLQRIFGNGNDVHERIQRAMELYGEVNWESEIPIYYDDPPVRGHADSTFTLDGVDYVGEIKSCSHTVFENRLMFNKPKPEHFVQPNIYAYILQIEKIAVIYENKSCVPDAARALTKDGWKHHYELSSGDEIMTYNIDRHEIEWEPYRDKTVFHLDNEPIYRVGNKHQSFLATKDHRWAVKTWRGEGREVRATDELNSNSWVPLVAPFNDTGETILSPYEAEVLGWIVSDGWIARGVKNDGYYVCQSKPRGVRQLFELLDKDHYTHHEYDVMTPTGPLHVHYFYIIGELRDKLREFYHEKSDEVKIVSRLNAESAMAFRRGMLRGDGSWSSTGLKEQLVQLDGYSKEAFQIACLLTGDRLNINKGKMSCYPGTREWMRTYTPSEEMYTGDVWCPHTKNGFWIMEQDGKAVITGNSQEIKVFVLDADYDEAEKQLAKWRAEWLCYQDGKLPKRPYKLGSPTCAECDLRALCWGEGQEEGVSMSEYKKQAKNS